MVDNAPILSCHHAGITVEGYSRAAVQSYWRIPELKIGFDLGAQPWDFMGTPTWLVTHTHLDHVAALPVYVGRARGCALSVILAHFRREIGALIRTFGRWRPMVAVEAM
jgi:hypothetical protein